MKLFEYEAKAILHKYGINIPKGKITRTPEEVYSAASEMGVPVFLNSQITVSGRGKAGGILPAATPDEARKTAAGLFGKKIKDVPVSILLVEEKLDIKEQYYASVAVDRQAKSFGALVSTSGGDALDLRGDPRRCRRHRAGPGGPRRPADPRQPPDACALPLGGAASLTARRAARPLPAAPRPAPRCRRCTTPSRAQRLP